MGFLINCLLLDADPSIALMVKVRSLFFRSHEHFHAVLVERKWLSKIFDGESVPLLFEGVFDLEVEPLLVAFRVCINIQE